MVITMKIIQKQFSVSTKNRNQMVDITSRVQSLVGETGISDGQATVSLKLGDIVEIRKHEKKARFVANTATTYWGILLDKLRWAAPPSYRDRGR